MGEQCQITNQQGYFVQIFLGILSFLILIYKRHKERPRRMWKIWMLDNSKQGVSALMAHMLNVVLAVTLSDESDVDACNWYFVTILLDTTLGVFICFVFLTILEKIFEKYGLMRLKTGNYFQIVNSSAESNGVASLSPDETKKQKKMFDQLDESDLQLIKPVVQISYCAWLIQLIIWNGLVVASKLLLYIIQSSLTFFLQPIVNAMFSWLDSESDLKLVLVMVIFPAILNSIQFWIQDNFLKKKEFNQDEKKYFACQIYQSDELGIYRNDSKTSDAGSQGTNNQFANSYPVSSHTSPSPFKHQLSDQL